MALKSVYIDSFYNPTTFLPKATLTSVPNPTQYNVRRRGSLLLNKADRHSLYLNSALPPPPAKEKLAEISTTDNAPSVNQPYTQILASLNTLEKSINKKITDLHSMGVENYVNKEIRTLDKNKNKKEPVVNYPESTDCLGSNVISTNEHKSAKPRKQKYSPLPISAHETESKKRRKK